MSVTTWYLVAIKAWNAFLTRRRTHRFLARFWDSPSLNAVASYLDKQPADEPFSNLTQQAILATRHHQRHGANKLNESGSTTEFLTRSLRVRPDRARVDRQHGAFSGIVRHGVGRVPRARRDRHERPGHAR